MMNRGHIYLVEIVILPYQFFQLALNIDDLLDGELELDDGHAGLFELDQESNLARLEEH